MAIKYLESSLELIPKPIVFIIPWLWPTGRWANLRKLKTICLSEELRNPLYQTHSWRSFAT